MSRKSRAGGVRKNNDEYIPTSYPLSFRLLHICTCELIYDRHPTLKIFWLITMMDCFSNNPQKGADDNSTIRVRPREEGDSDCRLLTLARPWQKRKDATLTSFEPFKVSLRVFHHRDKCLENQGRVSAQETVMNIIPTSATNSTYIMMLFCCSFIIFSFVFQIRN